MAAVQQRYLEPSAGLRPRMQDRASFYSESYSSLIEGGRPTVSRLSSYDNPHIAWMAAPFSRTTSSERVPGVHVTKVTSRLSTDEEILGYLSYLEGAIRIRARSDESSISIAEALLELNATDDITSDQLRYLLNIVGDIKDSMQSAPIAPAYTPYRRQVPAVQSPPSNRLSCHGDGEAMQQRQPRASSQPYLTTIPSQQDVYDYRGERASSRSYERQDSGSSTNSNGSNTSAESYSTRASSVGAEVPYMKENPAKEYLPQSLSPQRHFATPVKESIAHGSPLQRQVAPSTESLPVEPGPIQPPSLQGPRFEPTPITPASPQLSGPAGRAQSLPINGGVFIKPDQESLTRRESKSTKLIKGRLRAFSLSGDLPPEMRAAAAEKKQNQPLKEKKEKEKKEKKVKEKKPKERKPRKGLTGIPDKNVGQDQSALGYMACG